MIYSGSGSSSEFSEFRIRIQATTLNLIIKKNLKTICHFIFHTTVLQYAKFRIHREITFLLICPFIFSWIRIHADPDPQHCLIVCKLLTKKKFLKLVFVLQDREQYLQNNFPPRFSDVQCCGAGSAEIFVGNRSHN